MTLNNQESDDLILEYESNMTSLQHQVDDVELRLSKIDIRRLEKQEEIKREEVLSLQNDLDDLTEEVTNIEDSCQCIAVLCLKKAQEFMRKLESFDEEEDSKGNSLTGEIRKRQRKLNT
eukprot:CAMPEP_0114478646 /NCGR_PEP_ID=MMETSP0104-20121206/16106_1 /TAXON_ID=37642 ORGANISM="Paraphysomonas imperforata, Strain PA2" /NCGR_SAMPLE_ID=MMETSP0104 /ASSEMBLY_ACC=CAM_ASM_000202 /LENGTH=118 /DNA_ID=CAMNT_0001653871 /DNA_START=120 /DNA_END=473 /DNA_ORIENTATION=-